MTATSEVAPLEPKIPSALACPEGDIFSLPTKEDIVNAFNEIAAIPGQLQAKLQEMKAERERESKRAPFKGRKRKRNGTC